MKRKSLLILGFAIFLLAVFVVSGCGMIAEKATEKATEKAMEQGLKDSGAKDAKVDVKNGQVEIKTEDGSTFKSGSTYEWPTSIPSDVPKFTGGKINSTIENSSEDGKTVFVGIEGCTPAYGDAYKTALEQAGWKISLSSKEGDGTFMYVAEKDKIAVTVSFSDKGASGGVTVYQKLK
ncbi:MAG TPA: hypothetical protein VN426_07805 [Syntrophomonadaceae bacterium]|nr:hypothetical protein [Syntrophomonadaceae bacterium]